MMETNSNSPAPATSKEEIGNALMMAAINCAHVIDDNKVVLRRDAGRPGNSLAQLHERLVGAAPELVAAANESARNQRMFMDACEALGAINEKLDLDPDDGGADPIIEAIDQLQADLAAARRPAAEPLHDNLRDQIGQAINDAIASGAPEADYCDSREIDRLADAVLAILPPLRAKDDATQRATSATSLVELREHLHGAAQAGELIVLAPEAAGALVLAMSTGAPAGGAAPSVDLSGLKLMLAAELKGHIPVYVAADVRSLLAAAPVAPAGQLTQGQVDYIGQQWDECMYDGIDIGAAIRAELAKMDALAVGSAPGAAT